MERDHKEGTLASPRLHRCLRLAAACTGLLLMAPNPGPQLVRAEGAVEIGSGQPPVWRAASPGQPIDPGDAVRTGAGASAELRLGTRTVRLYENSVLRLPATLASDGHGPSEVELESGRSLFDVMRGRKGDRFQVRTQEVVVSVKGTRFLVEVDAEATTSVAVFRGSVGVRELSEAMDHEVVVRPGFSATGGAGAPIELRLTPFEDPWSSFGQGKTTPSLIQEAITQQKTADRAAREALQEAAQRASDLQLDGVQPPRSDGRVLLPAKRDGSLDPAGSKGSDALSPVIQPGVSDRRLKPTPLPDPSTGVFSPKPGADVLAPGPNSGAGAAGQNSLNTLSP